VGVSADQTAGNIPDDADLVIASAAIKPDHPQMAAAVNRGLPVLTYAEALGKCMLGRTGVALAGTHGKSTTTAMLGVALTAAGLDPTVIVGATCAQLSEDGRTPTGFRLGADAIPSGEMKGRPGLLLAEACEFNRSFHNLRPTVASISAVEADHLDIYGSLDAVVQSFREFAAMIPPESAGGRLIIAHEGAHRREVTAGLRCAVETIGFSPGADWHIDFHRDQRRVTLSRGRDPVASWRLPLPGEHMAFNSALACALAVTLGADPAKAADALAGFTGVDRRVQLLGQRAVDRGVVRVYDDYGHHPTEVDATLRALREFERPEEKSPAGRLICVFQPHQHSRTRFLLEEFAQAFSQADMVIVPHIYFVRDSEIEKTKVSAADLVDRLRKRGVQAMHLYPFEAIVEHLEIVCRPNDLLVVMGAGPVWQIAHEFLKIAPAKH
jgi:UDP-N-acetylmuramate--alanine ligase